MSNLGNVQLGVVPAPVDWDRLYEKTPEPHSNVRNRMLKRDGHRCVKCSSKHRLTMDHVIPKSKGGKTTLKNVQTLCFTCNQEKADRIELDTPPASATVSPMTDT